MHWSINLVRISIEKSIAMESIDDLMLRTIQVHNQWFYEGWFEYRYYTTWGLALRGIQGKWKDKQRWVCLSTFWNDKKQAFIRALHWKTVHKQWAI